MEEYFIEGRPRIEINIGEQIVSVTCYISIKDVEYFEKSRGANSSEIVFGILSNHIDEKYKTKILEVSEADIENFIDTYTKSNESFNVYYINSSLENKSDRFVEAFQLYTDDINFKMKETLNSLSESIYKFKIPPVVIPNIKMPKIYVSPEIFKVSESIAELTRSLQSFYTSSVYETIRQMHQTILNSLPDYSAAFAKLSNALADLAKSIKIPSLSDEQKEALQESYKVWGQYGWTVPPSATLNVFNKKPQSLEEANEHMRRYINAASMKELFIELSKLENIRKDDLEEAIANFENRRYKSCAMILFALIDGKIIRYQNKETNRRVGLRGAQKIYGEMELELSNRNAFFSLLNLINVNNALMVTFASGNNFKNQPDIVNRNFIHHGMLHSRVRRRDAAQLFLLLYNLIGLVD
ncbi:MAG: hypothetical protein GYA87_07675 [Christensenellaceae bacterium]|nr:hypothetical protein [Christensenellaceae bacterium]